jgi:D-alanyl-D-alanine carboxypeptidase
MGELGRHVSRRDGFATAALTTSFVIGACVSSPTVSSPASTVATASAVAAMSAPPPPARSSHSSVAPLPSAAPLPLLGSPPTTRLDTTRASALQASLDAAVRSGAPDVIAAVITEDGAWAGASGVAGANERKATATDEFAIASITKTFTAALVLRLAEHGKLDLDAPLTSYLGDLEVDTNGATVRQALEMRAGLADFGPEAADHIHVDAAHVWTTKEILGEFGPPIATAGSRYLYSSAAYELLSLVAAHVTGKTYSSALRAEILDPWDADRIIAQGAGSATPKPWALPVGSHLGAWTPADLGVGGSILCISSATYAAGAGSIASDASSLAAWAWHLFAGDILSPRSLQLLTPRGDGFAYGVEAAPYGGGSVGASGGKTGYGAQFTVFPASHAVIVIFVNDPDFIVEPTVTAMLEAATAS